MEEILHEGRFAGLFVHPSSLPNVGGLAGDFGKSAYAFVDYLVNARLNYWQVLPLGPCKYNGEQPGCPYLATSTFALNPLFVSVEALVDEGLVSQEEVTQILADIEGEEANSASAELQKESATEDAGEHSPSVLLCGPNGDTGSGGRPSATETEGENPSEEACADSSVQKKLVASDREAAEAAVAAAGGASLPGVKPAELSQAKPDTLSHVNFVKTAKFKEAVLTACYKRFKEQDAPPEFAAFCEKNSFWLEGYACFEALQARFPAAPTWLQWPDQYRDYRACRKNKEATLLTTLSTPLTRKEVQANTGKRATESQDDSAERGTAAGDGETAADAKGRGDDVVYQTTPAYHMFVQYKVFAHWMELKNYANRHEISIFGDVAFYVNLHSSDVWTSPEMFQMNTETSEPLYVSGSPPDAFCEKGQLWGHPVYDWQAHEKTHFRWWTRRIKMIFEHVDALRLDHFRGFVAYWRVPYEHAVKHKDASKGEWVRGPADKLFDALYKNMGWQLPKKTIPAAMQQQHVLGAKKAHKGSNNGFKHKLRQMACLALKMNNSPASRPAVRANEDSPAAAVDSEVPCDGVASVRQKSPDSTTDIDPSNEPRLTYRGTAPMIVAEDLGLITEEIVILRDRYNILSMRVLQFGWAESEKGPNCEHLPYNITRNCCVYTGTHDNDTLIGWWANASTAQKQHLMNFLGLTEEPSADEARLHLMRLALESVAHLVILAAQDLIGLGTEGRFNTPGVDSPRNWSWQLESLQQLANPSIADQLGKMLEAAGRVKAINDSFPS